MTGKLEKAIERLTTVLPLIQNQHECAPPVKRLHQRILRSFIVNGRAMLREEMAILVNDVSEALHELSKRDLVTLSETGELTGIYPFSTQEREHSVLVNGHLLHVMCALDALAVSPMFNETTQITSQCRVTSKLVIIKMRKGYVQNIDAVSDVHVGIAWSAVNTQSTCADSLCLQMIFLIDKQTAKKWQADETEGREIFTLHEAVEFASRFFSPLLT